MEESNDSEIKGISRKSKDSNTKTKIIAEVYKRKRNTEKNDQIKTLATGIIERRIELAALRLILLNPITITILIFMLLFFLFILMIIMMLGGSPDVKQTVTDNNTSCSATETMTGSGGDSLTHTEAQTQVNNVGISIKSSGNCSDRNRSNCTSLDGILQNSICGITNFKNKSGLSFYITGGTETGHAGGEHSHGSGWKIDISRTDRVSGYIKSNFAPAGVRNSDKAPLYKDGAGNIYALESDHWDIAFVGNNCSVGGNNTNTSITTSSTSSNLDNGCAATSYPPTTDNCNGKYNLNNPIGNFGDPTCTFSKDQLYSLLQQYDAQLAKHWFHVVVPCESGYNPNAYNNAAVDSAGAWGLFQMGRGKNGPNDHGDVNWEQQASNAVFYNKMLINKGLNGRYWECWDGH